MAPSLFRTQFTGIRALVTEASQLARTQPAFQRILDRQPWTEGVTFGRLVNVVDQGERAAVAADTDPALRISLLHVVGALQEAAHGGMEGCRSLADKGQALLASLTASLQTKPMPDVFGQVASYIEVLLHATLVAEPLDGPADPLEAMLAGGRLLAIGPAEPLKAIVRVLAAGLRQTGISELAGLRRRVSSLEVEDFVERAQALEELARNHFASGALMPFPREDTKEWEARFITGPSRRALQTLAAAAHMLEVAMGICQEEAPSSTKLPTALEFAHRRITSRIQAWTQIERFLFCATQATQEAGVQIDSGWKHRAIVAYLEAADHLHQVAGILQFERFHSRAALTYELAAQVFDKGLGLLNEQIGAEMYATGAVEIDQTDRLRALQRLRRQIAGDIEKARATRHSLESQLALRASGAPSGEEVLDQGQMATLQVLTKQLLSVALLRVPRESDAPAPAAELGALEDFPLARFEDPAFPDLPAALTKLLAAGERIRVVDIGAIVAALVRHSDDFRGEVAERIREGIARITRHRSLTWETVSDHEKDAPEALFLTRLFETEGLSKRSDAETPIQHFALEGVTGFRLEVDFSDPERVSFALKAPADGSQHDDRALALSFLAALIHSLAKQELFVHEALEGRRRICVYMNEVVETQDLSVFAQPLLRHEGSATNDPTPYVAALQEIQRSTRLEGGLKSYIDFLMHPSHVRIDDRELERLYRAWKQEEHPDLGVAAQDTSLRAQMLFLRSTLGPRKYTLRSTLVAGAVASDEATTSHCPIHVEVHGRKRGKLRRVLFLSPDYGEAALLYDRVIRNYVNRGFYVVIADHRGHGFSAYPRGAEGYIDSAASHFADLEAVLGFIQTDPALKNLPLYGLGMGLGTLGHSFLALKHPRAFKGLGMVNPAHSLSGNYAHLAREFESGSLPYRPLDMREHERGPLDRANNLTPNHFSGKDQGSLLQRAAQLLDWGLLPPYRFRHDMLAVYRSGMQLLEEAHSGGARIFCPSQAIVGLAGKRFGKVRRELFSNIGTRNLTGGDQLHLTDAGQAAIGPIITSFLDA